MFFLLLGVDIEDTCRQHTPDSPLFSEPLFLFGLSSKNPKQAFQFFCNAASLGHPLAPNNLGWAYEHGLGVLQDFKKAEECYKKASNDFMALFNLAVLYEHQGNNEEALHCLKKAAELIDLAEMQKGLALYLKTAVVPQKSKDTARRLIEKAKEKNISHALELLETFADS